MAQPAPESGKSESMEDILQSIKRIIEDDTGEKAPAAPAKVTKDEGDVLDLTNVVPEAPFAQPSTPLKPAEPTEPAADVMQSIDAMFTKEEPQPVPEPEPMPEPEPELQQLEPKPAAPAPSPKPSIMEDALVSDETTHAAAAALKNIAQSSQKDYAIPRLDSPHMRSGNTVEDLMLEAIRPMLKAWLDEHLPTVVQKIVEKEVKRIVAFHTD